VSALLGACSKPQISQNALLDDIRATDLTPHGGTPVPSIRSSSDAPEAREPRLYPGDRRESQPRRVEPLAERNAIQQGSEGYQLNFDAANISDVARVILTDTLHVPYAVDSRVQGTVTLATGRPVSRDELIKVFETALRLNNAALIGNVGGYRIVPLEEAAGGELSQIRPYRPGESDPPGYGVTIMPLRNISAESALRLLDGFLARSGSTRAETTGNMLLVRGTSREREQIIEVIETFDVDWLRGQSAGIFPVAYATPDEIIQELTLLMNNEQAALSANMLRFQAVPRLNAILALARRPEHLQLVGTWIKRLDKTSTAGQQLYVYQVENGRAVELARILNETFNVSGGSSRKTPRSEASPGSSTVSQFSSESQTGSTGIGQKSEPASGGLDSNRGTAGVNGTSTPQQVFDTGASSSSSTVDVRVTADEANNALLIRASQIDYQRIVAALRQIDRQPTQVLINATIAEVTLNDALRYGVQAYLKASHGSDGAYGFSTGHAGTTNAETLTLSPSFPGLNLLFGAVGDPRVVLDALASITEVKVVSSPSVLTIDNQPATLKVGDEVPIATQQAQSVTTPDAPVLNTIRFRETGVILRVIPRINSSGLVTMDVEQEISQVANNEQLPSTGTLTPTISQRRIASTVSVYSGQTVALGGLISEQNNSGKNNVPLINRIPYVGDLIGKTDIERKRTELIVFIKPQVVRNGRDASRVSEDLRSKLRSMAFEPIDDRHRWRADILRGEEQYPGTKDVR
jgi:general secretion pathway protein D